MGSPRTLFVWTVFLIYSFCVLWLAVQPVQGRLFFSVHFDKWIHGFEFAGLCLLATGAFYLSPIRSWYPVVYPAWFYTMALGVLTEFMQIWADGRHSDKLDLLADLVGSVIVVMIMWICRRRLPKGVF